ncbi:ThiF family adenylyltransferase [Rathayibacter sp. YIM 133350]|uniref:ThiF family adenylyltransferase n=1 Tax=Rathayibacter sp. YIM 133350 TaxID=3131992 RepID=UPI00307EAA04
MRLPPLVDPAPDLSTAEAVRTSRQIRLPEVGELGQRRLTQARVLVLGAGGLGSPVLLYLAAAGVGTIGIVDDDVVEPNNLQRQLAHGQADVGRLKVDSAAEAAERIAPHVQVRRHPLRFTPENARELAADYDLVIDGSDNFETRYLADDICAELGLPLIWGAVLRFDAQVSLFWATPPAGEGVRLRDVFPVAPGEGEVPSCSVAGVLGALCGQAGSLMAAEAVKLITGVGDSLLGRVVVIDALTSRQREVPVSVPRPTATDAVPTPASDAASPQQVLADPRPVPANSALPHATEPNTSDAQITHSPRFPSEPAFIDAATLADRLAARERGKDRFVLLDVREPSEHSDSAISGSVLLPLGELLQRHDATGIADAALPLIVHCHIDTRARRAATHLASLGLTDVTVLQGGMLAWEAARTTAGTTPSAAPTGTVHAVAPAPSGAHS